MEKQILPQIEKHLDSYKIIIPVEVENKIRYLCNRISEVEWSGTLFYTYSGSYENKDLEIKCVDILLMDIGSAGYTEFDMSPEVISYMTEHPELMDCQVGLIHSHARLSTFFSGTDLATLREEGNDRNHFVSLIVNNAGTYTAAITRKLTVTKTFKYKSFEDVEKNNQEPEITEEVIAYNMLTVIKEGQEMNSYQDIDEKITSIKEAKDKIKNTYKGNLSSSIYADGKFLPPKVSTQPHYQKNLFDNEQYDDYYMESAPLKNYSTPSNNTSTFPESYIKSITLQLITGSIAIADSSRIDPMKWSNQMIGLFDKRFPRLKDFEEWAEMLTEFIIGGASLDARQDEMEYISELATEVHIALSKLPENKYINIIKDKVELWIM